MLRASENLSNLKILLPMISRVSEVDESLSYIARVREELIEEGFAIPKPEVGVMIEVPSMIFQIPNLKNRVDFISLGTNDLIQYLLAADRNNDKVTNSDDILQPAVLAAVTHAVNAARTNNIPLSVCGEAAGDPAFVILLIALSVNNLSLSVGDLPRIKWLVRSISQGRATELFEKISKLEHVSDIRQILNTELIDSGLGELIGKFSIW